MEAIRDTVSGDTAIVFDPYGRFPDAGTSAPAVCLGVVGEEPYAEGLGDSDDLKLPVGDLRLLHRLRDTCDRVAVILLSGRPLIIADRIEEWDAFVAGWLPGSVVTGQASNRPRALQLVYDGVSSR